MAARSWYGSPTVTARPPSRGPICCVIAAAAACAPRCWPPGTGRWDSGARCARCSRRPASSVAGSTRYRCSCRAAEVGAPGGEEGARRDLERRGQVPRPRRGQGVRVDLWCEVSEGGRQDQRRRRAAAGVLRLPGRALDSSENYKSDRIYLRHRAEPEQDHQGPGLPRRRNRHGLQADRGGPVTLAGGQRAPSRGARPRRREVQERQTRRTARRHHRYRGGRIKDLDPQVLTIAPTNTVSSQIQLGDRSPQLMAISKDGKTLYVTTTVYDPVDDNIVISSGITKISTATNKITGTVKNVGLVPYQITVSPDGKNVYVTAEVESDTDYRTGVFVFSSSS